MHAALTLLHVSTLIGTGQHALSVSVKIHQAIDKLMSSSTDVRNSDVWQSFESIVERIEDALYKGDISFMRYLIENINMYRSGPISNVVTASKNYSMALEEAVNALLNPAGSLLDWRRSAKNAVDNFSTATIKLGDSVPSQEERLEMYSNLEALIASFTPYSDKEIDKVIRKHESWYAI